MCLSRGASIFTLFLWKSHSSKGAYVFRCPWILRPILEWWVRCCRSATRRYQRSCNLLLYFRRQEPKLLNEVSHSWFCLLRLLLAFAAATLSSKSFGACTARCAFAAASATVALDAASYCSIRRSSSERARCSTSSGRERAGAGDLLPPLARLAPVAPVAPEGFSPSVRGGTKTAGPDDAAAAIYG